MLSPPQLPADLDQRIAAGLRRERIDPSYAAFVRQHLTDPGEGWRFCCGSRCDPCANRLAAVIDGLRVELGLRIG